MICPACQTENIEGSDECSNCGAALYGLDLPGASQGATSPDFIHRPLRDLPRRNIIEVGASDPVGFAVRLMQRQDMNCVLIMDGGKMAGILTSWDILQKVAGPNEDLNAVTCGQVMTPDPFVLNEDDSIAVALSTMASSGIRHVPIIKDGKPQNLILATDLFRHISPHLV